jgi:hypothetical protein
MDSKSKKEGRSVGEAEQDNRDRGASGFMIRLRSGRRRDGAAQAKPGPKSYAGGDQHCKPAGESFYGGPQVSFFR